jgi:hypothetical protein
MTIEEGVSDYLEGSTGIHDKIADRIYPIKLPQNPIYPALTYRVISGLEHHNIDVAYPRFQFSCWGEKYSDAKELAGEVKSAFQRMNVPIGGTSGFAIVQGVFLNETDMAYDIDTELYGIAVDIRLIYRK